MARWGAAAAVLVLSGCSSSAPIRGGPLAPPDVRTGEYVLMDVGRVGTYGAETIGNAGRKTAILDRIDFVRRSAGLEIVGPLVMHVRTKAGVPALATGLIRQYPPPHAGATLHAVKGFRIAPRQSWKDEVELLIGFRAHRGGVLSYRGFELHYQVGDTRYVATYRDTLTICAPSSFPLHRCRVRARQVER